MLQRIQSLALGLIVLSMVAFLNLPLWEQTDFEKGIRLTITTYSLTTSLGTKVALPYACIAVGACTLLLLALYAITLHANRSLQSKFVCVLLGLAIGLSTCTFLFPYQVHPLPHLEPTWHNFKVGALLPLVAAILSVFALVRIQKDHRLVNEDSFR